MANVKELFEGAENGTLTYEQFEAAAKARGAKFTDLSTGSYVSKSKYEADIGAKDTEMSGLNDQITHLNDTLNTRAADLSSLQSQLEAAQGTATTDRDTIASLNTRIQEMQQQYDANETAHKEQMAQQQYEFAVREFVGTQKFSSAAAKRDFTAQMMAQKLQMKDGSLIGANDFVEAYKKTDADAFYTAPEPTPAPEPEPTPAPAPAPVPTIVTSSTPGPAPDNSGDFQFHFTGVRAHN